ncbi:MAG: hypothetical protein AB7P76_12330 [Candidatus Melainabacteria bacterium]
MISLSNNSIQFGTRGGAGPKNSPGGKAVQRQQREAEKEVRRLTGGAKRGGRRGGDSDEEKTEN